LTHDTDLGFRFKIVGPGREFNPIPGSNAAVNRSSGTEHKTEQLWRAFSSPDHPPGSA
jgi:hypothetical protein